MNRDLFLMSLSNLTWGVGEGMFIYFQSLYLQQWGADPLEIGAILGGMGVVITAAMAPAGWLADRVGARPVMWAAFGLGCIAGGIMALAGSLPVFVAGLLTYAVAGFVSAPMNSYITSVRGRWTVQRALTFNSAMFHLGAVVGPAIGGYIGDGYGLPVVYRVSAVIFVVSTVIVLLVRRPPVEEPDPALASASAGLNAPRPILLKNPRFAGLLVMIFLTMFSLYLPQPLTANYLQNQHGLSLSSIGQIGSANSLGNVLIMLAFGHLNAPVGFLLGQGMVAVFALLMWQGNHVYWFGAGYFFLGGYRLCRSMALAFARTLVEARDTGFAYGLVETGNACAAILAPLAAGLLYSHNPHAVYIAAIIAIGAMAAANQAFLPGSRGKDRQEREINS